MNWTELGRTALTAMGVYLAVVVLIRVVGTRATSRMNNFDWIVTVAIGSIAASAIILKDVGMVKGLVAIGTLIVMQVGLTMSTSRSKLASRLILASPTLLAFKGRYLEDAMRHERISKAEVEAALRESGLADIEQAGAVVLEPDAKLSVLREPVDEVCGLVVPDDDGVCASSSPRSDGSC